MKLLPREQICTPNIDQRNHIHCASVKGLKLIEMNAVGNISLSHSCVNL